MEGQGQSFFGGSGGFFGGVSLLDDRQTLQQKRDEYIIDIRRQERMSLLENNKKVCQEYDEAGERQFDAENLDLSYLDYLPNAQELKAHIELCLKEDFDFAKIPMYVKLVTEGDLMQKHTGIILLRKCLTQQNTPIQQVIDLGVVPYLVNMIQDDTNPHLQIEATWCITNLAVGDTNQTRTLVQKGVIQIYVQMLRKQNTLLLEQIVWGIGNISGDCIEFRDMVIKSGAMINLVSLYEKIKDSHPRLREQLVWTASNICRQKPAPDINRVQSGIKMFAEELKITTKSSTLIDCCWGLAQCCRLETLKYFVEAKILNKLCQLMFSPQLMISQPSLRIIGVFTNGDDSMCQMVIEENGLAGLEHNLNNTTKAVRKEALWAISNITAGNQSQIGAVISRNSLVEKLFTIAVTDAVENQVEAIWSLCNATKNASFEQIQFLLSKNLLDLFASNLGLTVDNKILNVVLESLYVISEKIKGSRPELMPSFIDTLYNKQIAQKVSSLQEHSHNLVYKKSYKFITEFLEVEDPY